MSAPNKYQLYEAAVMDAKADVKLFRRIYREIVGREPLLYREDFCGTFRHSAEWVKLNNESLAYALDKSHEPLRYGELAHYGSLKPTQRKRLHICRRDVLHGITRKVDLVTAMNFSYSIFKERNQIKNYFRSVHSNLKREGLFLMDILGGSEMHDRSLERRKIVGQGIPPFDYYWEQKSFNPISQESLFAIHFRLSGSKRIKRNQFVYDWRLWTLPELKDLLTEVGFKNITVYWEGTTRTGRGNGIFSRQESPESSEVWIAYIAAQKSR